MRLQLAGNLPGRLHTRLEGAPVSFVTWLRVNHKLLRTIDLTKAGRAAGTLGDSRVEIPADSVVEGKTRRDLPRVLYIGADVIAVDGCGTDVFAIGKVRRCNGDGIDEGAAGEEPGEGVRQWIACTNVMHSAHGWYSFGRISGAAAETVFAVGT